MDQNLALYHHTDDQAPMTGGTDPERQRVELLHRVLVTGYGSKAGAGWTQVSTSTAPDGYMQHFTARQPYGNGIYVRVERGLDIVAARDAENSGATEADLIQTWRAGLDANGHLPPNQERWFALANDRTFYLSYSRTATGEPYTGDQVQPAAILEAFVDFDDLMAQPERSTGYLVGGASATTQMMAWYGRESPEADATECSAAIEGYPGETAPHYAAIQAPMGQKGIYGSDAGREARLSRGETLQNRLVIDALVITDADKTIRGYLPNARFALTGFVGKINGYSADDWPALGGTVIIDGVSYVVGYAGANGDHVEGAPNSSIVLFTTGA